MQQSKNIINLQSNTDNNRRNKSNYCCTVHYGILLPVHNTDKLVEGNNGSSL